MKTIYLDFNSTTPVDSMVISAIKETLEAGFVNPSSQHRLGQNARQVLETEKSKIVELLGGQTSGTDPDRLIVTSGGTEANNLAVTGSALYSKGDSSNEIIVSSIEHPSVLECTSQLRQQGFVVHELATDASGVCNLGHLEDLIHEKTILVSVMLANHETGVIQPAEEIGRICGAKNIRFHCDATQAVGKMGVDFASLNADLLTVSPHKFYGPRQVGALLTRRQTDLAPILFGGQQQLGSRPGTEDIAAVVGMRKALEVCLLRKSDHLEIAKLRETLEVGLLQQIPNMVINGVAAERLPNTINLSIPGINRQALLMAADVQGLALSTGSACASGSSEPSPVLTAMGLSNEIIESSVRISLGRGTTSQDVDFVSQKLRDIVHKLRS